MAAPCPSSLGRSGDGVVKLPRSFDSVLICPCDECQPYGLLQVFSTVSMYRNVSSVKLPEVLSETSRISSLKVAMM